jgi:glycosyltransferase involved in cell wall biosynthesis
MERTCRARNASAIGVEERVASGPVLSIGLPVYNGSRHLRESLDSLLAQDIGSLELVISDNASTDDTAAVCLEYASADSRVRYTRTEVNVGAAANFNRVFGLCSGEFFMWASHDDRWDPRFARTCVESLRALPKAVACASQMAFIKENGEPNSEYRHTSIDTYGMSVEARAHDLIAQLGWYGIYYCVFRRAALEMTQLYRSVYGGDVCLLMELALLGASTAVPETLFYSRIPDRLKTPDDWVSDIYAEGADNSHRSELREPYCQIARELLKVVGESSLDASTLRLIREDFVQTLSVGNPAWRDHILRERGVPSEVHLDVEATRLLVCAALGLTATAPTTEGATREIRVWQMRKGFRFGFLRRIALRLMQPFGDRQDQLNRQTVSNAESIEQLTHEIDWLRRRLRDLERRDASGD